ncbi:MAG TPA: 3-phosphoshikimate 1-carboxyvinyltransferase [Anaerolineales bacterium]|nr:3-phosphoshikimate 1-carboxyvinyltransferase [Anaerolineales bacterium]
MNLYVRPCENLFGRVDLPGDKSISHRAALLAGMAVGTSMIHNFLRAGVTEVMLEALSQLGVFYRFESQTLIVESPGISGWQPASEALYCGHSGTTMRLLAGALAAARIPVVLDGSSGLRARPMGRIIRPLQVMGVQIAGAEGNTAPLTLSPRSTGDKLQAVVHKLPVASAQVKSTILLAGLAADGETNVLEPGPSRDHTERMFAGLGFQVARTPLEDGSIHVSLIPPKTLEISPLAMTVPGDISSAAFLLVAGLLAPNSKVTVHQVGINPTRTGLLDALEKMGAKVQISGQGMQAGEPVADLEVAAQPLQGVRIGSDMVVRMIDEFPIFAIAAAAAEGTTIVSGAEELRYKETDRIAVLCRQLRQLGVKVEERQDGFVIEGSGKIRGGSVDACGDHRLAMSLAVAGLVSQEGVTVRGAEIFRQSYPEFVDHLTALSAQVAVTENA